MYVCRCGSLTLLLLALLYCIKLLDTDTLTHLPPYHLPHTIIAWETRNTFIKHTNKISTLTQSHTHQKK